MAHKKPITEEGRIYTAPPPQLLDLENKSVVLAGDTLLDPIYLAYLFAIASSIKTRVMVNKVDFMYLQGINGGELPDDMGVSSIDVDCDYQNQTVSENDSRLRPSLNFDLPLQSQIGSLALVYEMIDRGVIDFYEFRNQYLDGICFLQTGDPNIGDSRPESYDVVYGWQSVIADLLRGKNEHDYWNRQLTSLGIPPDEYIVQDFLARQIYTRVGCIGRSARTKEPFITHNPWTISWLNKSGIAKRAGPPLEERCNILLNAFSNETGILSIGEAVDFIDNRITQATIRETLERDYSSRARRKTEEREDWLILVLNLVMGIVPAVSQLTTIVTHFYQRQRGRK